MLEWLKVLHCISPNNTKKSIFIIPSIVVSFGFFNTSCLNELKKVTMEKPVCPKNIIKHKTNFETSVKNTWLATIKGIPKPNSITEKNSLDL